MSLELIILVAALLLLLSIGATRASRGLGIPALILFLAIGMLAGSDGPGGITFDNAALAQAVGVVALVFILFAGGLGTDWRHIRPVLAPGLFLATVGVLVSTLIMALFAVYMLGFTPYEGMLLGAVISSTDAAAVFSVLRMQHVHLRGNLEPLIELESGTNDPMAIFLTLGFVHLLGEPGTPVLSLVPEFFLEMGLGAVGGYLSGRLMVGVLNRARLQQEGLYAVFSVGLVLLAFSAIALVGGSGFLAVYIAGMVVGNRTVVHKRSITRFHDGIAWLMQITMFLTLGLLVYPSELVPLSGTGILTALVLVFVARPISVFASVFWAGYSFREMLVISWAGLRGAAPIVLATFALLAGVNRAAEMFNIVFYVVLVSVLLQGSSIRHVARWLGVMADEAPHPSEDHAFAPEVRLTSSLATLNVQPGSPLVGRAIVEVGLPRGVLVVQIIRERETLVPSGGTVLAAGDELFLLATPEALEIVQAFGASQPATLAGA